MENSQKRKKTIKFKETPPSETQKKESIPKIKSRNDRGKLIRVNTYGDVKDLEKCLLNTNEKKETNYMKMKISEQINYKSIQEKILNTDQYGFIKENSKNEKEKESLIKLNERIEKWNFMLMNFKEYKTTHLPKLKERTRKGIPDNLRGLVWQKLGSIEEFYENDLFIKLNEKSINKNIDFAISQDLDRTFPECEFYKEKFGDGQKQLYKVLSNYSKYNEQVGYVQGMAFITAILLIYMDEEKAFFLLHSLMKKYNMENLYLPGFPDLKKKFFVLLNLEKKFVPKVYNTFYSGEIMPFAYAADWFFSLFARSVEFKVLVRIFDVFFLEGFKVVYRFALAILKINEKEFINKNANGVDSVFIAITNSCKNLDVEELFKIGFGFSLSKKDIDNYEKEYEKVKDDMDNEFIKQL